MKSTGGGEIVSVEGGHILRSLGRKDRHSKIFTAKGPRDRRIRLSAHTAIQFYDVQDRLGYDRPSKAVDWLIKKAKNAIDKLPEQPPWHPINDTIMASIADSNAGSTKMALGSHSESCSGYAFQIHKQLGENPGSGSSFLPPSSVLHTQSISDTMKSFFPMSSGTTSPMNFQDYPHDLMATTTVQTEDLCQLSLHSLQDPSSSGHAHAHAHAPPPPTDQTLFPAATFQANHPRLVAWSGGGNIFSSQPFLCQSSMLSQKGPLQSSFSPSLHANWDDQTIAFTEHHTMQALQYSSISSSQFSPQGLLDFRVPPQIQSEEQHGVVSNKPCSHSPKTQH